MRLTMVLVLGRYFDLRVVAQPQQETRFNCDSEYSIGLTTDIKASGTASGISVSCC
jgi:hypothetical protein